MEISLQQHCSKSSRKSNDVFIFVLGRKLNPTPSFHGDGSNWVKWVKVGQKVIIFIFFITNMFQELP